MRAALFLSAALLNAAACAIAGESYEYISTLNGSAAGGQTVTYTDSSEILGTGDFVPGGIHLDLKADRKLEKISLTQTAKGVARTYVLDRTGGKYKVVADGKSLATPDPAPEGISSAFFPVINSGLDQAIDAAEQAGRKSIRVFFFDSAQFLNLNIGRVRTVVVGKSSVRVRTLELSGIAVDFAFNSEHLCVGMEVPVQKFRTVAKGYESVYRDPFADFPELSPAGNKVQKESVWTPLSDGVKLRGDLVRPIGAARVPTILIRTPYGREVQAIVNTWYAERGYAVLVQDVRGKGESEGKWDPMVHEARDGDETISWITKQRWSNGRVGMIGASYGGYVQWAAASRRNPALRCIVPQVSPPMSAMRNLPYLYGAPLLFSSLWWLQIVNGQNADMAAATRPIKNPKGLLTLPLAKVDQATLGFAMPGWLEWLARDRASKWDGWNFQSDLADVTIPSLSISGYYDGDQIGTMLNWEARAKGGQQDQWLIYGPWPHGFNSATTFGGVEFGPTSVLELDPLYLRFFDTWLKMKDVGWSKVPRVRAFITGSNRWHEASNWPIPESRAAELSLLSGGRLGPTGPARTVTRTYDPSKTKLPAAMLSGKVELEGSLTVDPKDVADGHLFRAEPFRAATTVAGPISLDLRFKTSAKSTDFFAVIFDQSPDGKLLAIGQPGAVRASYLDGDTPTDLIPGQTYSISVRMWDFVHEFAPGHRMVLYVTNEIFPAFARNLGTNEPILTGTRMVAQRNTIFLGKGGSVLRFRVLP